MRSLPERTLSPEATVYPRGLRHFYPLDDYFARLNQISVSDTSNAKVTLPTFVAIRRRAAALATDRRGRSALTAPSGKPTGPGQELSMTHDQITVLDGKNRVIFEPNHLRHQHQHPALPGQGHRVARPGPLRVCGRRSSRRGDRHPTPAKAPVAPITGSRATRPSCATSSGSSTKPAAISRRCSISSGSPH